MKINKVKLGAAKFYNFLMDADKPLYEGCMEYNKFAATAELYHF
jgi:hypothetical protein